MITTDHAQQVVARIAFEQAAAAAGVHIRALSALEELELICTLFTDIWATPERHPPVPMSALRALSFSGSYVAGAFRHDVLVGGAVALLSQDRDGVFLFGHGLAVRPEFESRGIGFAIKQHKRAWAAERGIGRIRWTFDPLEPRNANLYVDRIGVESTAYLTNFYGPMRDEVNKGDESDRILVSWRLDRPESVRPVAGAGAGRGVVDIPEALSVGEGSVPRSGGDTWQQAERFTIQVPRHIRSIRRSYPELAAAWRLEVRRIMQAAFGDGYRISAASRDGVYCLARSGVDDAPSTARQPAAGVPERR